jgi:hypothetical protein
MRRTRPQRQYALAYFRRRIGPWCWTKEEVKAEAVRRGDASRDGRSGVVYLTVPADIIERWVDADNVVPIRRRPVLRIVR